MRGKALCALFLAFAVRLAHADVLLEVDSTLDLPDAMPNDGLCAAAGGECTLRAALGEARTNQSFAGAIEIRVPPGDYVLDHVEGDLVLNWSSGDLDLWNPASPLANSVAVVGWHENGPAPAAMRPRIVAGPSFPRRLMRIFVAGGRSARLQSLVFEGARAVPWSGSAAADNGGAIACIAQDGGTLRLEQVEFRDNRSESPGAAIFLQGCGAELTDVAVDGSCGRAAAMLSTSLSAGSAARHLVLDRVSITRSSTACLATPGDFFALGLNGFRADEPWNIALRNVTIAANAGPISISAPMSGGGRQISIRQVTIEGNGSVGSGAVKSDSLLASGSVVVKASHSTFGSSPALLSDGVQLVSAGPNRLEAEVILGASFQPGGADLPLDAPSDLAPLGRIGEYSDAMLPGMQSALVDAGAMASDDDDLALCTTQDQGGTSRPQGQACDLGAVELVDTRLFADGFE